jgi:hypothetical protein
MGPPELTGKDIISSVIPEACKRGAVDEGTQKEMRAYGRMRLISFAAGRLITVSPTQFVPLTTIRAGGGGDSCVMLEDVTCYLERNFVSENATISNVIHMLL